MEQPDREASLQHSADHLSFSDPDVVANALAKIRTELRTSSEEGALVIKVSGFSPPLLTLATCLTKKDRCSNGFGFLPIHFTLTGVSSAFSWFHRPPRPLGLASLKQLTQSVRSVAVPCCRHVTAATRN